LKPETKEFDRSRKDAKVAKGEILMPLEFEKIIRVLGVLGALARDETHALCLAAFVIRYALCAMLHASSF
jgi:hypothetical protein